MLQNEAYAGLTIYRRTRVVKTRDCSVENRMNAYAYQRNAEAYRRGEHRAWEGEDYRRFLAEKMRAESSSS